MAFTCGNCKCTHSTVAEGRACYQAGTVVRPATAVIDRPRPARLATEKQVKFLTTLLAERAHGFPTTDPEKLERGIASQMIDQLLHLPKLEKPAKAEAPWANLPEIPAGHYAIKAFEDDDNPEHDIRFYRVDRPEEGVYAGKTFVKVLSSDTWHKLGFANSLRVLEAIAADGIEEAGMLFAQKRSRCRKCNRGLTDATSREQGYGPECINLI